MELAPGVYSLGVQKGFATHAFLVAEDDGFTLIDTLFDADGLVIADAIRALGGTLADLKRIVLTHAHRSHLGGLAALKRLSGARVYSHAWEADIIAGERAAQQVSWWPQNPVVTYHFQVANNLNISRHRPAAWTNTWGTARLWVGSRLCTRRGTHLDISPFGSQACASSLSAMPWSPRPS